MACHVAPPAGYLPLHDLPRVAHHDRLPQRLLALRVVETGLDADGRPGGQRVLHPAQRRRSGRPSGGAVMSELTVVVEGHNFPGASCGPNHNVHVGLQVGSDPSGLVSGSAAGATWSTDVRVVDVDQGHDFRGKAVHGKRAERFLYLTWGEVDGEHFTMFRRAKL